MLIQTRPLTWLVLACAALGSGCSDSASGPESKTQQNTGGANNIGGAGETGGSGAVAGSFGGQIIVPGQVRWIGRVDASNPASIMFAWSGTGFVATVEGTKISVQLQSLQSASFYQPIIDGTPGQRIQVPAGDAQTVVLGDNLAVGQHQVELYRDTEGQYGVSVFKGFVDGTLIGAPVAPGRLIEVIGDSISAGYGNLGVEVHPPWDNTCSFTLETEAAYQSYSWQLARLLHADVSIIARSGWGVYRDYGGSTSGVLSSIYENTLGAQATPKWDFTKQPDAVLINLGTNDSTNGDPGQPYEDAYVALLKQVRSHYANAWFFLTIGPMTSDPILTTMRTHIANVVTTFGDGKVAKLDIATQDLATTGCDYHPDLDEDTMMADNLHAQISAKLGW